MDRVVTVRAAHPEDLSAVRRLLLQLPIEPERDLGDDARASSAFEQMKQQAGHTLLIAEADGEIVATIVLLIVPNLTHDAKPWAMLENFVVADHLRAAKVSAERCSPKPSRSPAGLAATRCNSSRTTRGRARIGSTAISGSNRARRASVSTSEAGWPGPERATPTAGAIDVRTSRHSRRLTDADHSD